jgi:PAS domain S-box-containing protein
MEGTVGKTLRVLIVEDNEDDARMFLRELESGGYSVAHRRVETSGAMRRALMSEPWDIVLSDYTLPSFSAPAALEVLRSTAIDVPFIIISGTIGEEAAVASLKAGAHDFMVKGRLARLIPAVDRELREAAARRKQVDAELQLYLSESKYRRIVETSQEGIWEVDPQLRTTYANRKLIEMLGAEPEALLGAYALDFIDERWRDQFLEHVRQLRMGRPVRFELRLLRGDGVDLWGAFSASPVPVEGGADAGAFAMVTDVTESRKLREQLLTSERMASVGALAASVAHEINNPLTVVLGGFRLIAGKLDALARPMGDGDELGDVRRVLADALEAAERIRNVSRDLRIFSRVQEEGQETVDVRRVLESTLRMAQNEIRHRARLITEFGPVPAVEANESRLGQVFLNLVVNAAQSLDEGRVDVNEIRVRVGMDDAGRVAVEIQDTGSGMPPEVIRRLFTPFFTTKPAGVGTGLGLSICHRIVASFGGEIEVESAVGVGSTFRVLLPASQGEFAVSPPIVEVEPPLRRAHVLVVDDEAVVAGIVKEVLETEHEVTAVTDAREALRLVAAGNRYDVILCDLMMPSMSGMDLHAELSRADSGLAERMVFVTGGAFTPATRAFLERVRNEHIEKPFDFASLLRLVNERVSRGPTEVLR